MKIPARLQRRPRLLAALTALALAPALTVSGLPSPAGQAAATSPAPPTTPVANSGPATSGARLTWQPPAQVAEEQPATLAVSGELDGQARLHVAIARDVVACPATPSGGGSPIPVAPSTTPGSAFGSAAHQLTATTPHGGTVRLCGWVVPAGGGAALSTFDQPYAVVDAPATVSTQLPPVIRAGTTFPVTFTGTTSGTGRRVLAMGEPHTGQTCRDLRKGASGSRPLQGVFGVGKGTFTRKANLRFRAKATGPMLLCLQVVEIKDRVPEAEWAVVVNVAESLKCERAQQTTALRTRDLQTIRTRRDAAKRRLDAAKKQAEPRKRSYLKKKRASDRRVAAARKQWRRAKGSAKKTAARRLANVRRSEARKMKRARAPYAKAERSVKRNRTTWQRHRRGVRLIEQTIKRTRSDLTKYCANPVATPARR